MKRIFVGFIATLTGSSAMLTLLPACSPMEGRGAAISRQNIQDANAFSGMFQVVKTSVQGKEAQTADSNGIFTAATNTRSPDGSGNVPVAGRYQLYIKVSDTNLSSIYVPADSKQDPVTVVQNYTRSGSQLTVTSASGETHAWAFTIGHQQVSLQSDEGSMMIWKRVDQPAMDAVSKATSTSSRQLVLKYQTSTSSAPAELKESGQSVQCVYGKDGFLRVSGGTDAKASGIVFQVSGITPEQIQNGVSLKQVPIPYTVKIEHRINESGKQSDVYASGDKGASCSPFTATLASGTLTLHAECGPLTSKSQTSQVEQISLDATCPVVSER